MIKLNNKNITYVALADNNNSLKAPKEIWYADSNNSVKLVYKRKDALIESEDYEKYHWLKGDGIARISTNEVISSTDKVECVIKPTAAIETTGIWQYVYCNNGGDNDFTFMLVLDNPTSMYFRHYRTVSVYTPNNIYTIEHSINSVSVNSTQLEHITENQYVETNRKLGLFFAGDNPYASSTHIYTGYIGEFKLIDKLSLIPCKLLKPVPKWLDANGIRRQVGECGMIDLVSGKFYGNVNSVGTFTVENYYERKEWLIGDGSAYIDTGHNTNEDLDLETKVGNIRDNTFLFWFRTIQGIGDESMIVRTAPSRFRYANNSIEFEDNLTSQPINVETFGTTIFINGIEHSITKYYPRPSILFRLFYAEVDAASQTTVDTGYTTNNVGCSYFRFLDSNRNYIQNLIPCTLTMDLPASMDANNIARTKGTSGMWDLVSDRFYGNVASSGTFKAVNLAEGVDYERHQWLVGDGSSTIKVIGNIYREAFSLVTVPTTTAALRNLTRAINASYDGNYSEYQILINGASKFSIRHGIRINNIPTAIIAEFSDNYVNNEYEITTYRDGDYYYGNINGVEYKNDINFGEYQFADEDIEINILSYGFKLGNFNSGRVNLIPVKLLHSISSKYDANGIARQAGECGMYDTINDVFYGNVASSGTFSVSDDE